MRAPVAVVNQPHALSGAAIMHRLLQGIENEPRMCRAADAPADDASGMGVDDEGDLDRAMGTPLVRATMARAFPTGDVGEL